MRGGCYGCRGLKGAEVARLLILVLVQESPYDRRSHNRTIGGKITA